MIDDAITMNEKFTDVLRKIIREEVSQIMLDMPAAVDDSIQTLARETCEACLDDELDDRVTNWMTDNLHDYLEDKIRVVID